MSKLLSDNTTLYYFSPNVRGCINANLPYFQTVENYLKLVVSAETIFILSIHVLFDWFLYRLHVIFDVSIVK